ncbi:hypothetical protein [Halobacillus sp. A5]|uniref:hypothetical protein n=1 Tax=Halobacillus sp. A5 TaxID=2880263 RepID=UPI0020A6977D|nr:hypothetical protein [Halobacillus sp. A5]MCP3028413.1 hypothetical protein [Halobacillus sp. A5]
MKVPKGEEAINHTSPIVEVPIDKCRDWQGFSYKKEGWHYLCETMKQLDSTKRLAYKDSLLYQFYMHYQPASLMECLFYQGAKNQKLSPKGWPPLPWKRTMKIKEGNHQHFGPNQYRFGEIELRRIHTVYKALKENGYRPAMYKDGYIRGYFLKKPGEYRFIISAGQHRIAALAVMNQKEIRVKVQKGHNRMVTMKDIDSWPQVENGIYDKETARRIFQLYFKSNGREKAKAIGLLPRK